MNRTIEVTVRVFEGVSGVPSGEATRTLLFRDTDTTNEREKVRVIEGTARLAYLSATGASIPTRPEEGGR